jgi:hypothetical protein
MRKSAKIVVRQFLIALSDGLDNLSRATIPPCSMTARPSQQKQGLGIWFGMASKKMISLV